MIPAQDPSSRLLIDDAKVPWMSDLERDHVPIIKSLFREAVAFGDQDLYDELVLFMKLRTAIKGKRAHLFADTIKVEPPAERVRSENVHTGLEIPVEPREAGKAGKRDGLEL